MPSARDNAVMQLDKSDGHLNRDYPRGCDPGSEARRADAACALATAAIWAILAVADAVNDLRVNGLPVERVA